MGIVNRKSPMSENAEDEVRKKFHASKTVLMMSRIEIQPLVPVYGTPIINYTLRAYLNAGWTIYFVVGFKPDPVDYELIKQLNISWFQIPLLRTLERLPKIGFFARAVSWLVGQILFFVKGFQIISKHKVDLIYTWDTNEAVAAWILSKIFAIPWVARYLGTPVSGLKRKVLWKVRLWQLLLAYKLPADIIIMTNDGTQGDKVLQELGVDMSKVRFWMNGVDWEFFNTENRSEKAKSLLGLNNMYVLLCISRLVSWKRVDRSISALPDVVKEHPNTILVIVGDGPERERLEQLALQLGVREHVRFEGAVLHSEIPKYLAAADIFLSFYDWSNVGNPLLEAMMAGKCIVTLNNGDTGRFIQNNVNGVLLDYEDLPKLPKVINELLSDEERRKRLGSNAYRFAKEHFWSWEERLEAEVKEVEKLILKQFRRE